MRIVIAFMAQKEETPAAAGVSIWCADALVTG
jgi:hypothetical protein